MIVLEMKKPAFLHRLNPHHVSATVYCSVDQAIGGVGLSFDWAELLFNSTLIENVFDEVSHYEMQFIRKNFTLA